MKYPNEDHSFVTSIRQGWRFFFGFTWFFPFQRYHAKRLDTSRGATYYGSFALA